MFETKTMNPFIKTVAKSSPASNVKVVTKGGIAAKIFYFFIINLAGVAIEMSGIIPASANIFISIATLVFVIINGIVCTKNPKATPIFGTIYSLLQGYVIGWVASDYAQYYDGIVPIALGITGVVVFSMLLLYSTGVIKVGHKFRSVVSTLFLTVIITGIIAFVSSLFTPTIVNVLYGNGPIGLIFAIISALIMTLHLAIDFDNISKAVNGGAEKMYEWTLAMGLVTTILMLFLRILEILGRAR